ncbi:DUF6270 domain-containing protein [Microbacterium sp. UFMG61]|uniref:DUF6270 domain-containing protein n=1 Tax=Microbacterium sp. UFMG61 TaxID=2745935 RepID=UPI00188DFC8E|nr:DUF6270 domain-containing protein [Microbacterium sp. UFMG61]
MHRVFIYGSCVTRDGVEHWPEYGLDMTGYIARQSLISATAPARPSDFNTGAIASPFQKRMADGDIVGNVIGKLTADPNAYDIVLWDITDERLGVYRVPSGGYVSRVVNYENGIYRGADKLGAPVRVGSAAHRELWLGALDTFVERLEAAGVKDRVILNAIPWATKDEDGRDTSAQNIDPRAFNVLLQDYSEEVAARGIQVAHPNPARVLQANTHKWGTAPFHYAPDTYHASLEAVSALL